MLEELGLTLIVLLPPASPTPAPRVPPNPVIMKVEDSIGLPGSDHLYAASRLEDNILKIGVSKGVIERMSELSRSFQAGYALQAVWPGEAALEDLVLEKLKPYKAPVGNSREHFDSRVTMEYLHQIVDHARVLYKTKMELSCAGFEQRKRELEFQEDLKDRALKRKKEEMQLERQDLLHELAREKHPDAIRVFLDSFFFENIFLFFFLENIFFIFFIFFFKNIFFIFFLKNIFFIFF